MIQKRPMHNRSFYPGDLKRQVEDFLSGFEPPEEPADLVGGVVPHAGWMFSGRTAAKVWRTLAERGHPRSVILFGAVHNPSVEVNAIYPEGSWETPLGDVEVDAELAALILRAVSALAAADPDAHRGEHSIEVQMPFIKALLPGVKVVPIAVSPHHQPVQLGDLIAHATKGLPVIAVGSTDLTHYGEDRFAFAPRGAGPAAHAWMKSNDQRVILLAEKLLAEEIPPEVAAHHNACGPGALAAVTAFARARGSEGGIVLEHTTSHEVVPEASFTDGVGYAGMVF